MTPQNNDPITAPTLAELGATLRTVATYGMGTSVQHGTLFARLTRYGNEWALELNDVTPVTHGTCDQWAAAVGAPSVEWRRTAGGRVARCEWIGTEDPAGDAPRATLMHGGRG
jgi:hypothetical protein